MEKTLILLKPDAVEQSLVPSILERLTRPGLRLLQLQMLTPPLTLAQEHYAHLRERGGDVFARNTQFLASGPVVAVVLEGPNVVVSVRKLIGATEPVSAAVGTIRGDFSSDSIAAAERERRGLRNLVHASDSTETALREIALWFPE
jgi:nucleoside-diphosphate kinase